MQLRVDDLVFTFDDIHYETFDDPANYHGVDFTLADGSRYEVLSSKLGMRLLINLADGFNKDVPFHEGTFWMLPAGIQVTRSPCSSTG